MNERESACKTYFSLAKKRIKEPKDGLNKQFYAERLREIWSAFDGFLGWKFLDRDNKAMREKFSKKYQPIFENWTKSDKFKESTERLLKCSPVTNMLNQKLVHLSDPNNLEEILNFSYTVRSNLDHGAKDLESDSEQGKRNRELVEHSFKVTYTILEKALLNEGVI